MLNLLLWAHVFSSSRATLEHSVLELRFCCSCARSGEKYELDSSSTMVLKTGSSAYRSPKLLLPRRDGQNHLVSQDQVVEAGFNQGRGEDKGELEGAFGQVLVALCSV